VTFDLLRLRLHFTAVEPLDFVNTAPGNVLRGAFGSIFRDLVCNPACPGRQGHNVRQCEQRARCAYARTFEPASLGGGPSGLADHPRPFVFRVHHLQGKTIAPGDPFKFDVNLFDTSDPPVQHFIDAFARLARARFDSHEVEPVSLELHDVPQDVQRIRVEFKTPTELKSQGQVAPEPAFDILSARIRDRVSTLRALYGNGPLEIDFRALADRAAKIRMTSCDIQPTDAVRRSSRTGQVHGIGGFTGTAEYEGQLDEFVPYLEAGQWTGVGRHCVWGNGEISFAECKM